MAKLKPGVKTSEFYIILLVMVIGILFILYGKSKGVFYDQKGVESFMNNLKDHTDEYIGSIMIVFSAASYIIKRCVLKYFEIKFAIETMKIEAKREILEVKEKE